MYTIWVMGVRVVASRHPGFTTLINNVELISLDNSFYGTYLMEHNSRSKLQPEEKSVALMKDLLFKASKRCDFVLDRFVRTLFAVNACLLLDNH